MPFDFKTLTVDLRGFDDLPSASERDLGVEKRLREAEGAEPILRFFRYSHLSVALLRDITKEFAALALGIMLLARSAERTVALRKLLESKDAAARAALHPPT